MTELTVWHDGHCPLCRREIALMRRLDRRGAIRFVDATTASSDACPIDRRELLACFHAREGDTLLTGAAAFAAMWRAIPPLRPLGLLARSPTVLRLLKTIYWLPEGAAHPPAPDSAGGVAVRPRPEPVGPGQESVWDYPRPAIAEPTGAHIVIEHGGRIVAHTRSAVRTLETSHPPSYYIPCADIAAHLLRHAAGGSFCEWKGSATYWDVVIDEVLARVGWSYATPTAPFTSLRDHVAF